MATHQAGHPPSPIWTRPTGQALREAVFAWRSQLAQAIVRDGEGATKFITVQVRGGRDEAECRWWPTPSRIRRWSRPRSSPATPTWAASWRPWATPASTDLDQTLIDLHLDDVHVATRAAATRTTAEADGQRVMKQSEITVRVHLHRGARRPRSGPATCRHDYVSINADYRS
jgi:glutamate N-acetyltransferase/amino-acid N-acetyltransferase